MIPAGSPPSAAAGQPHDERPGGKLPDAAADERLCGWGRQYVPGREIFSEDLEQASIGAVLSRGLGRSYGDSSLPPADRAEVLATPRADRILAFDHHSGRLRAEAGLSLREIVRLFMPRRWFIPVTPGTQFVTLGGMVAADVHGKNHHQEGTFGRHVRSLRLRTGDGQIVDCSPEAQSELFWATVGGMGLTGHILEVEFDLQRIPTPWIYRESERKPDIDAFITGLKDAGRDWPFTVGWIDCLSRGRSLGRGILLRGRWASPAEAPAATPRPKRRLGVPFVCPSWLLGRVSVKAFNSLYYACHLPRRRRGVVHPEPFFYPLDRLLDWNKLYGPRGFTQYQCVLPEAAGPGAARRFLEVLTRMGGASFLCIIKDCGAEGQGLLSFPMPGISIALDIPVRRDTRDLVDRLNETVIEEGGRIYLAKDCFTRPEHFARMEPRLERWQGIRERWDPNRNLRSAQSTRLFGDHP